MTRHEPVGMQRAYATLDVKAVDDSDSDHWTITGIATTPNPDRIEDIVDPMGATFKLPMPLLWQHDSKSPIGNVVLAKATKKGIPFTATIPKVKEEGNLKKRIEEAVQSIQYRLVACVSIGFRVLNNAFEFLENGGIKFNEWEWLELSVVTIPMNADATIQTIKSYDKQQRAALGHTRTRVVQMIPQLGDTSKAATPIPEPTESKNNMRTIAEQIAGFTDTRTAKKLEAKALLEKGGDSGLTMDADDSSRYDELVAEIETLDAHLGRLNKSQRLLAEDAAPARVTTVEEGTEGAAATAAAARDRKSVSVVATAKVLPKGIQFARFAKFMAMAGGNAGDALAMAKETYPEEAPLHNIIKMHVGQGQSRTFIQRTAVAGALTSNSPWAGALVQYQDVVNDFLEYLRPKTIVDRLTGVTRVPFKTRVPRQTGGGSASWVGEGKAKPLTSGAFDNVTLDFTKIASIAVLTDEIIRLSTPSAEALTRDMLAGAIIQQLDSDFIDPSNAGTANVKPASVTNGVTPISSAGNSEANVRTDLLRVFAPWIAANMSIQDGLWIMSSTTALALSLMVNGLGQPSFPDITVQGGTFRGFPVIVSDSAGVVNDSAGGHIVVLLAQKAILLADDGQVAVDLSREASLEMSDAPANQSANGTGASLVSMFQTDSVAIRAERWINWVKGRSAAVQWIQSVNWGE